MHAFGAACWLRAAGPRGWRARRRRRHPPPQRGRPDAYPQPKRRRQRYPSPRRGRLEAHHAFWRVPDHPRHGCTITELIHVPESARDGLYLLNLQVAPMDNDAAISRPVLHPLV